MDERRTANTYKGLGRLLYIVRWSQHLLAIIAEVLILLSFAMSGMDVSLGGILAEVPFIKVLWAGMFALGIDTAFALSWVRVRQCVKRQQWWPLAGNMILAFSMSLIVFQPIAVQLLQQSLNVDFNQAVDSLGVNIVFLTYARSAVAVFLGAILAMTNVESDLPAQAVTAQPKRQFILIEKLFHKDEAAIEGGEATLEITAPANETEAPFEPSTPTAELTTEQVAAREQAVEASAQPELTHYDTPEQRAERVSKIDLSGLIAPERVAKVLKLFPDLSDRELGKLSGMAPATAKKHREALKVQAAKEGDQ